MSAQFPIVPPFPGVPPLARDAAYAVTAAEVVAGGVQQYLNIALGLAANAVRFGTDPLPDQIYLRGTLATLPKYGFFMLGSASVGIEPVITTFSDGTTESDNVGLGGSGSYNVASVLQPDSVIEFAISADSAINSHPVEEGGFVSYNRVQDAISIRLLLGCQGNGHMTGQSFISALQSLREGTQVLTISTPDATYPNMALKAFGYKKTSDRGFVTIWADTQWQEERSTNVTVTSPPAAQPQGNATSNLGTLQAATPAPNSQAIISNPPVPPASLPSTYASTQPPSGNAF